MSERLLRIGVTGHRDLRDSEQLRTAVRRVLRRLTQHPPGRQVCLYSALAQGADQLVVEEALAHHEAQFVAILPLPPAEYIRDFPTAASRQAFENLLGSAVEVVQLESVESRTEAYRRAGHYIVDHTDVLIACWDGGEARGPGGTAEVVAHARGHGRPLVWIRIGTRETARFNSTSFELDDGQITWERLPQCGG